MALVGGAVEDVLDMLVSVQIGCLTRMANSAVSKSTHFSTIGFTIMILGSEQEIGDAYAGIGRAEAYIGNRFCPVS